MQTFKHKTMNYYTMIDEKTSEWVSIGGGSASVSFNGFSILPSEDFVQCPESEYLRVRDQALHFLNENRPKVTGASIITRERVIVTDEDQPTYKRL